VQVLPGKSDALEEDLFRSGALRADALLPRRLGRCLEERERTVKVHRPTFQVP
jgi:hypothetical protein